MSSANRWSAWTIAIAFAFALAGPVSAQQSSSAPDLFRASTSPVLQTTPAPLQVPTSTFAPAADNTELVPTVALAPVMPRSQSVALMIVGGAGLIVGSILDGDSGDIVMVGGAVAGLIGLYHYLR